MGTGLYRAHSAGVRALVAVVRALEVLSRGDRDRRGTIAKAEHGDLGALEQLLDDERARHRSELREPCVDLRLCAAHDDALAGCEPVGLEHARSDGLGKSRRSRYAGDGKHVLGEELRAFDRGGGGRRTEHRDPVSAENVGEPGDERDLRPHEDEVDSDKASEAQDRLGILRPDRMALPERRDARISRCCMELGEER